MKISRTAATWLAGLLGAGMLAGAALSAESGDPETAAARELVRRTVDDVIAVLQREEAPAGERIAAIEQIAYERFDFAIMSRLVLAKNYKRFTPEQRERFVVEFKDYLSRSYGNRVDQYEQEAVLITGARVEPRGDVTVLTRIQGGSADGIEMNYRVRERKQGWRFIDVVIEGVSLVANFRSQFKEVVSKGGPELLLERLADKNFKADAGEAVGEDVTAP